ncbi:MAG: DedA family protein [Tagaea sp.]|nr:DedA family protein [Tagaea sp.]
MNVDQLIAEYGTLVYAVTFVWTFFEGETFVIFAGAAAQQEKLALVPLFLAAWLGSFAGDQTWFWLGRTQGLRLLAKRPGWKPGVERAMSWLERYDTWFILTFRFVYGVRNFASFAMGLARIDPLRFAALNFVAAFVWAVAFVGFGYVFGHALESVFGDVTAYFHYVMLGVFVLAVGILALVTRSKKPAGPPSP